MNGRFASIPIWAVFVVTTLLALVAIEVGYRHARHRQAQAERLHETEKEAPVGAMVGAALGLLAFLLAITFGIAADGFHARKLALLDETNAIRAAYLRADLIAEPQRVQVRHLLEDYVDERLAWTHTPGARATAPARELLARLWQQVRAESLTNPGTDVFALFIESVNDVMALHETRTMVRAHSRIPEAVWAVQYVIALMTMAAMGYHGGVAGTMRSPVTAMVALAFALVIALIVDLDRPGEGWINVSQEPMLELRDWLAARSR